VWRFGRSQGKLAVVSLGFLKAGIAVNLIASTDKRASFPIDIQTVLDVVCAVVLNWRRSEKHVLIIWTKIFSSDSSSSLGASNRDCGGFHWPPRALEPCMPISKSRSEI
jgi:hypothetical protein